MCKKTSLTKLILKLNYLQKIFIIKSELVVQKNLVYLFFLIHLKLQFISNGNQENIEHFTNITLYICVK